MIKTIGISCVIIMAAGFLLNTAAYASYERDSGHYRQCRGGLTVYAEMYGTTNDNLRITFSGGGYTNSKVIPGDTYSIGYIFHEGIIDEYDDFKVKLRNLDSGRVTEMSGYNHAGCHPEYVEIKVPQ